MIERSRVRIPAGTAGEFSSPGSTFCADSYFGPFHPRVTAVARKKSRSFCQKCRWQVTAKHAYTLRIEPCFGIGHNLSLICQMTSEDIKHQLNNNNIQHGILPTGTAATLADSAGDSDCKCTFQASQLQHANPPIIIINYASHALSTSSVMLA